MDADTPVSTQGGRMITEKNQIQMYLHCKQCMNELPEGVSPRENARFEIGWTVHGVQAWCVRHESNILNVDFEGHKHPAITTRIRKEN